MTGHLYTFLYFDACSTAHGLLEIAISHKFIRLSAFTVDKQEA